MKPSRDNLHDKLVNLIQLISILHSSYCTTTPTQIESLVEMSEQEKEYFVVWYAGSRDKFSIPWLRNLRLIIDAWSGTNNIYIKCLINYLCANII